MIELNPQQQAGRIFAFVCYALAGIVVVIGIFFTIASGWGDPADVGLEGVTPGERVFMSAGLFLVIALMFGLLGRRVHKLFGQSRRQEKLAPKAAVGCLRLGSLGCGLWILLGSIMAAIIGKLPLTGEPASFRDIFIGASGAVLVVIAMQAVAWFISVNYVPLKPEDRKRIFEAYRGDIKSRLPYLVYPEMQAYAQEQTIEVLAKLDTPLRGDLMNFLSEGGLLTGDTRITLRGADFSHIDLRSVSLPRADLHEVNLQHATLQGAILFEANLRNANLKKVDLTYANLQGAKLQQADLTEAILEKANLSGADLTGANVTDMQLGQARLERTILPSGKISA